MSDTPADVIGGPFELHLNLGPVELKKSFGKR